MVLKSTTTLSEDKSSFPPNPKEWAKENNIEIIKAKPKHRYIFFHGSKTDKKIMKSKLLYNIMPYPKGDSKKYDSGGNVATQQMLFI